MKTQFRYLLLSALAFGCSYSLSARADTSTKMSGMKMSGMKMSGMKMSGMKMPAAKPTSAFSKEMMRGMNRMNKNMAAAPMNGNPDHDFASMMIPHHQGAIDMAQVELQYGKDPILRRLAKDIIAAQKKEIGQMQHSLAGMKTHSMGRK